MMFPYLDPTIVLLIPAVLFSLWAQFKVKGAFSRYSEVRASSGVTADQVSRELLDRFGLGNVRVERIQGHLTDHYDPRSKVLRPIAAMLELPAKRSVSLTPLQAIPA